MIREDYRMGWVVQPLNLEDTRFYLYSRLDTSKPVGEVFDGNRLEAFDRVDRLVKEGAYGYSRG